MRCAPPPAWVAWKRTRGCSAKYRSNAARSVAEIELPGELTTLRVLRERSHTESVVISEATRRGSCSVPRRAKATASPAASVISHTSRQLSR